MGALSSTESEAVNRAAAEPRLAQVEAWAAVNSGTGNLDGLKAVAGLLAGAAIADALGPGTAHDLILLPAEALNGDRLFIDSVPFDQVVERLAPARVVTGHEVTAALRAL